MASGAALQMRVRLRELAERHRIKAKRPDSLPLAPPAACPMLLSGQASSNHVDEERMAFAPYAFGLLSRSRTKLLLRHDPAIIAGVVEELKYDCYGNLQIVARVEHVEARRQPAFSIGAWIKSYEIVDADKPSFFARVTEASLEEVSLTSDPSNRTALVRSQFPANAQAKHYDNLLQYIGALKQLIELSVMVPTSATSEGVVMRKDTRRRWPQKGEHMLGGNFETYFTAPPSPPRPTSRGSFSELAARLNQMEA